MTQTSTTIDGPHAGPLPRGEGVDRVDVEWIVREVLRRLRDTEKLTFNIKTDETIAGTQRVAESLEINDRVITLSTLEKQLHGVRQVVVPQRAVVTPAVIDELRDRKIALIRGNLAGRPNNEVNSRRGGPLVVVTVENFDAGALTNMLGNEIGVKNHKPGDSERALSETIVHVQNNQLAVLLTETPVTAVVTGNRNARVRAAIGYSFPAVRQAVDEAGANLLAIDPRSRSISEIAGMIGEFVRRNQ